MTDKKKQSIFNRTIFDVAEHEMKFEVGDRVRVREWDDMEKEFVSERGGNLRCGLAYFMQDMRKYCGKVFFFLALQDIHPVSHWMPMPEAPRRGSVEKRKGR